MTQKWPNFKETTLKSVTRAGPGLLTDACRQCTHIPLVAPSLAVRPETPGIFPDAIDEKFGKIELGEIRKFVPLGTSIFHGIFHGRIRRTDKYALLSQIFGGGVQLRHLPCTALRYSVA